RRVRGRRALLLRRRWCRRDVLGCDLLPPGLLGRRRFGWRGQCFGLDGRGWAAGLWGQDVVNLSPVRVEEGVAGVGKLLLKSVGECGVWAVEVRKQSFEPAGGGLFDYLPRRIPPRDPPTP